MKLGIAGLGRMGANMARRLQRGGIDVVAYNRSREVSDGLAQETGLEAAHTLAALIEALPQPRVLWLMLPAGEVTQEAIDEAQRLLEPGDLLIDGANSFYKDSMRRAKALTSDTQWQCTASGPTTRSWIAQGRHKTGPVPAVS